MPRKSTNSNKNVGTIVPPTSWVDALPGESWTCPETGLDCIKIACIGDQVGMVSLPNFTGSGTTPQEFTIQVDLDEVIKIVIRNINERDLPATDNSTMRGVRQSIQGQDQHATVGAYGLRSQGIKVRAQHFVRTGPNECVLALGPDDGVEDGNHSLRVLQEEVAAGRVVGEEWVTFRITTGVDPKLHAERVTGLSTATSMPFQARLNAAHRFDILHDPLEKLGADVQYRSCADAPYPVSRVVQEVLAFNPWVYGPESSAVPHSAARPKSAMRIWDEYYDSYVRVMPLVPDILRFGDYVDACVRKYQGVTKGSPAIKDFIPASRRDFRFEVPGGQITFRLHHLTRLAITAQFRVFVRATPGQSLCWGPSLKGMRAYAAVQIPRMLHWLFTSPFAHLEPGDRAYRKAFWVDLQNAFQADYWKALMGQEIK